MRFFLVAIVFGAIGVFAGFYRYTKSADAFVEIFEDPEIRLLQSPEGQALLEKIKQDGEAPLGPKIVVDGGLEHNFGSMETFSSKRHKFVFRNVGSEPSRLTMLRSSCKCTIGDIDKSTVQPGEAVEVELTWTAEEMMETFAQTATIGTDDPENREIKLTIRGVVSGAVRIDPINLIFGDIDPLNSVEERTTLYSNYEQPFEITQMEFKDTTVNDRIEFDWELRKLEPGEVERHPDAKYAADITMRLLPGLPAGRFQGVVPVDVSLGDIPGLRFNFSGRVSEIVRIIAGGIYNEELRVLNVGDVPRGESKRVSFLMSLNKNAKTVDGEPIRFEVLELSKMEESLKVDIREPQSRAGQLIFSVDIEVPEDAQPVSLAGTNSGNFGVLKFRTNIEGAETVRIFVRLVVE